MNTELKIIQICGAIVLVGVGCLLVVIALRMRKNRIPSSPGPVTLRPPVTSSNSEAQMRLNNAAEAAVLRVSPLDLNLQANHLTQYLASNLATDELQDLSLSTLAAFEPPLIKITPQEIVASIASPTLSDQAYVKGLLSNIPRKLIDATFTLHSAKALIYALLMEKASSPAPSLVQKQRQYLEQSGEVEELKTILDIAKAIETIGDRDLLPLAHMALSALGGLSPNELKHFKTHLYFLLESDKRFDLFEFVLAANIIQKLDEKPKLSNLSVLGDGLKSCAVLFSAIAHGVDRNKQAATAAFQRGAKRLTNQPLELIPPALCATGELVQALSRLRSLNFDLRKRIIEALAETALTQGHMSVREAEILRALCDALDCPIAPIRVR